MKSITSIQDTVFQKDLNDFLTTLSYAGQEGGFSELEYDLLYLSFRELVASDEFAGLEAYRKRELFNQYDRIIRVIKALDEFATKYEEPEIDAQETVQNILSEGPVFQA